MELQISYRICAEVPQESILQRKESSDREDTAAAMREERGKNHRGEACPNHIHLFVEIPPKISVSHFMGYLKGKSSTMLYEQFGELKYKYRNREFWCRGYYVDTVGKNESRIAEYVRNQLKEDEMGEQLRIPSSGPFTGGK